jgi:hypothetical protein
MKTFTTDFKNGFKSGGITGTIIAWLEVIKVNSQLKTFSKYDINYIKHILKESLKSTPQFSFMFGGACAIEFSVNSRIRKTYGKNLALIASAFTGAFFLTPAEHLMCISAKMKLSILDSIKYATSNGLLRIWTGMSSMIVRESFFIFNLFIAGEDLGRKLHKKFGNEKNPNSEKNWILLGRLSCGMFTTFASHPFDTVTRLMQKQRMENPILIPKLLHILRNTNTNTLFLGLVPRLIFANIGGTMAARLFENFSHREKNF